MSQYNDDINHSGVLGMKWGHRKSDSGGSAARTKKTSKKSKPDVKKMSDEELKKTVSRLQLEKQYSQLSNQNVSRGKEHTKNAMKVMAGVAAATTTALTLYGNAGKIKTIVETASKNKEVTKVTEFAAKHLNKGVDKDIAGAFVKF